MRMARAFASESIGMIRQHTMHADLDGKLEALPARSSDRSFRVRSDPTDGEMQTLYKTTSSDMEETSDMPVPTIMQGMHMPSLSGPSKPVLVYASKLISTA